MKDYSIKIQFDHNEFSLKWFDDKERKTIRNRIAAAVQKAIYAEVGEFMDIDQMDQEQEEGVITIHVG